MRQDAFRGYLDLALGLTEASRKQATKAVRRALGKGGATAEQLQGLADELLKTSTANREAIVALVRTELDRALARVGLAKAEEVADLQARVRELEAELRAARGTGLVDTAPVAAPGDTATVAETALDITPAIPTTEPFGAGTTATPGGDAGVAAAPGGAAEPAGGPGGAAETAGAPGGVAEPAGAPGGVAEPAGAPGGVGEPAGAPGGAAEPAAPPEMAKKVAKKAVRTTTAAPAEPGDALSATLNAAATGPTKSTPAKKVPAKKTSSTGNGAESAAPAKAAKKAPAEKAAKKAAKKTAGGSGS